MGIGRLTEKQRRVLTLLNSPRNRVHLEDLANSVNINARNAADLEYFRDHEVGDLIRRGYVQASTTYVGGVPRESFYLKGVGDRAKRKLQGDYTPFQSFVASLRRIFAFIFIISGLGFMLWQESIVTGNVVGSTTSIDIAFFASLALIVIGGILLFRSLKK